MTKTINAEPGLAPVEVPIEALLPETVKAVLESYILREGTDYGRDELSLATKIENLKRRISRGQAHLVFDPASETITFLTNHEWSKLRPK